MTHTVTKIMTDNQCPRSSRYGATSADNGAGSASRLRCRCAPSSVRRRSSQRLLAYTKEQPMKQLEEYGLKVTRNRRTTKP